MIYRSVLILIMYETRTSIFYCSLLERTDILSHSLHIVGWKTFESLTIYATKQNKIKLLPTLRFPLWNRTEIISNVQVHLSGQLIVTIWFVNRISIFKLWELSQLSCKTVFFGYINNWRNDLNVHSSNLNG